MLWALVVVGVVWGLTNKLLDTPAELDAPKLPQWVRKFLHWRFLLPFLANQTGSLMFYWALGRTPLSLAVPLANSVSFLTTMLLDKRSAELYIGASLIVAGMSLCLTN
jgi:threonine/homoserine efflux transporter RhtA